MSLFSPRYTPSKWLAGPGTLMWDQLHTYVDAATAEAIIERLDAGDTAAAMKLCSCRRGRDIITNIVAAVRTADPVAVYSSYTHADAKQSMGQWLRGDGDRFVSLMSLAQSVGEELADYLVDTRLKGDFKLTPQWLYKHRHLARDHVNFFRQWLQDEADLAQPTRVWKCSLCLPHETLNLEVRLTDVNNCDMRERIYRVLLKNQHARWQVGSKHVQDGLQRYPFSLSQSYTGQTWTIKDDGEAYRPPQDLSYMYYRVAYNVRA